jgi:hypothetical protein
MASFSSSVPDGKLFRSDGQTSPPQILMASFSSSVPDGKLLLFKSRW